MVGHGYRIVESRPAPAERYDVSDLVGLRQCADGRHGRIGSCADDHRRGRCVLLGAVIGDRQFCRVDTTGLVDVSRRRFNARLAAVSEVPAEAQLVSIGIIGPGSGKLNRQRNGSARRRGTRQRDRREVAFSRIADPTDLATAAGILHPVDVRVRAGEDLDWTRPRVRDLGEILDVGDIAIPVEVQGTDPPSVVVRDEQGAPVLLRVVLAVIERARIR